MGEATVYELAAPFPVTSRHLKVLERAGLIVRAAATPSGGPRGSSLAPLDEATELLQTRKWIWEERMDRLAALTAG